jgi:hypothetical protein
MHCNSPKSAYWRFLGAVAVALLAGCAGQTPAIPPAAGIGTNLSAPDVSAPPKCKTQKNSKDYASSGTQNMKAAGGNLCVPEFGGWGGDLQYPNLNYSQTFTVTLTSSTTAYSGGNWPPAGSSKPIFYIAYAFDGLPGFGGTLPHGTPIEGSHITPNAKYTVEIWEYDYGGLWTEIGTCSATAKKSTKYGGSIAALGAPWINEYYKDKTGVIEIFKGALVSNAC